MRPLVLSDKVSATDPYADDTTIYDAQTDFHILKSNLQDALISLHEWCKQNGMLLNKEKTKIRIITTWQKRLHIDESILSLSCNDVYLEITTGDKILGINIDAKLMWSDHFHFAVRRYPPMFGCCL